MLGQLQFPPILRLQKGVEIVADFQDAIRETFPSFAVEQQIQVTVPSSAQGEAGLVRTTAYRFTNEPKTWSVLLTPSALTLEAVAGGRYSSYAEFVQLFKQLWAAALATLQLSKVAQQGLRYVDHLAAVRSPAEWADWVNPELLGGTAIGVLGAGLTQSVSELTYAQPDGRIVFRHGMMAAGPQGSQGYLLDFDSIHTNPIEATDTDSIMGRFEDSHDALYRLFRWCVTQTALEGFRRVDS